MWEATRAEAWASSEVNGIVAHAAEAMDTPTVSIPATVAGQKPYRSPAQPTTGDRAIEAGASALTEPDMIVRDCPSPCYIGWMKTVSVDFAGAILANTTVP